MISFVNDYSEGACEEILERLAATNHEQSAGYGLDPYCERAAEKIRQANVTIVMCTFWLVEHSATRR